MMNTYPFEQSRAFLEYLEMFAAGLTDLPVDGLIRDSEHTAVVSVDVINGFCYEGALASPRVQGIVAPIVRLFQSVWDRGVRDIILVQEAHDPEAVEFGQFPPHCVRGTSEAQSVPELLALPFYDRMEIVEKNSISVTLNTGLAGWIHDHPQVDTFIVVGDCTDLCTYQLAMYLRLDANARQLDRRVVVPSDCVDTYDLPVDVARNLGAVPHDAELLHALFLYHMMLNGVEVVRRVV
jgi:nicotinamidase-related amidase